ncbi:hypothetical protein PENTCL1PPCAC_21854 [Pristionchus entomophagus]|uniref:Uncharacterized protein n=1 Tax=Pristionchus entomophagus TaxID=358040 RepID=A0AAV5TZT7_9BILA|nr:hypothetical protein PENTCL1PPCAC_21854 [Pristionchus entomophagus]
MFPFKMLQFFSRSGWSIGTVMRVVFPVSKKSGGSEQLGGRARWYGDWSALFRPLPIEFSPKLESELDVSCRRTMLIRSLTYYMVHMIYGQGQGEIEDINRLHEFVLSLPDAFRLGGNTIVIDGLNRGDLLNDIAVFGPSCNIIVIWRKGVKYSNDFERSVEESNGRIRVHRVTPHKSEVDDICASIIALCTNGQLYTNDAISNHLDNFEIYCKISLCASGVFQRTILFPMAVNTIDIHSSSLFRCSSTQMRFFSSYLFLAQTICTYCTFCQFATPFVTLLFSVFGYDHISVE